MAEWENVGKNVYARRYEHLDQTLGLVVGRERCLVIDTGGDEVQGEEFAAAIRQVTPLPWTVVITHAHFDHFFGTAPFLPCPVWAQEGCRDAMASSADAQRAWWSAKFADDGEHELADRLNTAQLVLPSDVVTRKTELDLGGREVVLLHHGPGHTGHDLIVHVPDAEVVFAGDLVESGAPPAIGEDAHPVEWPRAVDKILALRPSEVVPGHGSPMDAEVVREQRDELHHFSALYRGVKAGRMSVEKALRHSPFPPEVIRPILERVSRT